MKNHLPATVSLGTPAFSLCCCVLAFFRARGLGAVRPADRGGSTENSLVGGRGGAAGLIPLPLIANAKQILVTKP
jgi:hypothetical protein